MSGASQTAIDQGRVLEALLQKITGARLLWTRDERKDARILVGLLIDHSLAAERARKALEAVG